MLSLLAKYEASYSGKKMARAKLFHTTEKIQPDCTKCGARVSGFYRVGKDLLCDACWLAWAETQSKMKVPDADRASRVVQWRES